MLFRSQTVMTATGPLNENTGEFSNTGVEFTGSFKPTDKLTFNATCSYISMKELIVAAPEQQLNLSGSYKLKRLNFNLSLQHIHNLCTQISPSTLKESYTLFNSRISWNINKSIDIFIKGENLTNRKYSINYGYPMPGIIFFGGINLHL